MGDGICTSPQVNLSGNFRDKKVVLTRKVLLKIPNFQVNKEIKRTLKLCVPNDRFTIKPLKIISKFKTHILRKF